MPEKKDNTENNIKQGTNNVNVGNISKSAGVIIGSNIKVGDINVNVTNVIQEIKSFGLKYLSPDYFRVNIRTSYQGFDKWKNGFPFKLQDIMHGHHFQRTDIINEIINKLDDNNGNHALLLLGKSGTSKSILLMDIMCHYFKNDFVVFYNFGEEEIKDIYDLEDSLRTRLKDGNKILVAVDNVHDKKTATIFSVIDSIRSYGEKKDNIRFILTGRQPEFDRLVLDRLDTLSEPVRQSIQNLHKQISYPIPNFTLKEIQNFLERYKDEDDVKRFVNNNKFDYNKLFIENDQVTLNTISSLIYEKTNGDPILLKFFIFGKGFANDVEYRFFNYMKSEIKLQSMIICILLDRAEIPISQDLIEKMNLIESTFELTNETLTFLEDEKRWKTIHPKWDLELLAYLYNIKEHVILEKRKKVLRKALELLMNNLSNEKDRFSIFGFLYDSTTIDTEENRKFPIKILDSIVTNEANLIYNYLSKDSIYTLYHYYISKNYYYSQLYDKALDAIEEALKIYPNGMAGLINKGFVLDNLGQHEEAIKCYDEVITKLDPKHADAWTNKGIALDNLGRYEEAIKCYDEVITKLDPKYVLAWLNKGAVLDDNLGRYEEAIKCYDEVITKLDPKHVSVWLNKGVALENLGQHEEAIKCYDEIITKLDPKYVLAWLNKGAVLDDNLGRYEEAIKCYDEIITKLDPKHVIALNNKGWTLDKLGKYQEAIECYDEALEIDSNDKTVLDSKGYTLIHLDRYEEAIEYFKKALKIDPNYADPLEHKKIAYEKLRNRNK